MPSRRDFLASISTFGAGAAMARGAGEPDNSAQLPEAGCDATLPLEVGWQFRLDPESTTFAEAIVNDASNWEPVNVPHTWQTLGGKPEYVGTAWYRNEI